MGLRCLAQYTHRHADPLLLLPLSVEAPQWQNMGGHPGRLEVAAALGHDDALRRPQVTRRGPLQVDAVSRMASNSPAGDSIHVRFRGARTGLAGRGAHNDDAVLPGGGDGRHVCRLTHHCR